MKIRILPGIVVGCVLGALLVACASPTPSSSTSSAVADAFMAYKGLRIERDDFAVNEHEVSGDVFDDGYAESRYFVVFWPSTDCVEGYTVFESCAVAGSCEYKFEWVEGVCD